MGEYWAGVVALSFLVDVLLIMAANGIFGYPYGWKRSVMAAVIGGLYAGSCLFSPTKFLGGIFWRIICLGIMSVIAFGITGSGCKRGIMFALLKFSLGGAATGGNWRALLPAAALCLLCTLGSGKGMGRLVPVELLHKGIHLRLLALRDTGNSLRDPITGRAVLVVDPVVANKLTGLSPEQLKNPLEAMEALPGLRLIPYRGLGQPAGFMLGLRLREMRVGSWKGSGLVAFAPHELSTDGTYQALTGGSQ